MIYRGGCPSDPVRGLAETHLLSKPYLERGTVFLSEESSSPCTPSRVRVASPFLGEPPAWAVSVAKQAVTLLGLPPGWDSYGARRLSPDALRSGLYLLSRVMMPSTVAPILVPTSEGGVQIEWHSRGLDLEVEVRPAGEVSVYVHNLNTGREWSGTLMDAEAVLEEAIGTLSQSE